MAWNVEIHLIDVGQGESTLILAADPATMQTRSMLIDAGHPTYAERVHNYILANGLPPLTHIVVSHYDGDHSGGLLALLTADNLHGLCEAVAAAAGAAAHDAATNPMNANQDLDHQVAAAAAAAAAVGLGGYDDLAGNNYSNVAVLAGQTSWALVFAPGDPLNLVAREGSLDGEFTAGRAGPLNPSLLPTTQKRRQAAIQAGIVAGTTAGNAAARTAAARTAAYNALRTTVNTASRFPTDGIYRNTHIIDIGDTPHMPGNYRNVLAGGLTLSADHFVRVPGYNRQRTSNPALASELLWQAGPAVAPAAANFPEIFVVARRRMIWTGGLPHGPIASGQPDNDDSIGLILRFNQFFYFTGGDLPSQGEDELANSITTVGLPQPNPPGGAYPAAHRIACFKCGHHGSDGSTSLNFLNTAQPAAAFISAGHNPSFQHPTQNVINRLHGDPDIQFFYMTNCNFATTHVPASNGAAQLVQGNKSRVAGDNVTPNLTVGRQRGNIQIFITEAESLSPHVTGPLMPGQVLRQFNVAYYDDDPGVHIVRIESTSF